MKLAYLALAVVALAPQLFAQTPPPNDDCSGATAVSGPGTFAYNSAFATPDVGLSARSVWFQWTATSTGTFELEHSCSVSSDVGIAVSTGTSCVGLTSLGFTNSGCGPLGARMCLSATAGQVFYFEISRSCDSGCPGLSSSFSIAPYTQSLANDECTSPTPLSGMGLFPFDNSLATRACGEDNLTFCIVDRDLWYSWVAPGTGSWNVSTCGLTSVDTQIMVYAGATCPPGAAIACDFGFCGLQARATFPAVVGQTYLIRLGVDGVLPNPALGGPGRFEISPATTVGAIACFAGDGGTPACPCVTAPGPHGCANSRPDSDGGRLVATGVASVSSDSFVLLGSGMLDGAVLYIQGTNSQRIAFGDGLLCALAPITRLGIETNVAGSSFLPRAGHPSISVRGSIPPSGAQRTYQAWYRDSAAGFCTAATFNLTNAVVATWAP